MTTLPWQRSSWVNRIRIKPDSFTFTLLLGSLASLPTFGIDMILPSLAATGAELNAPPAKIGLAMSVYLLSLGSALLIYGPASDRYGRKPVALFGCALVIIASVGSATSRSFAALLMWRAIQGAGASGPATAAFTIIRDLFEGEAARAKMSFVVSAINVVPMVAPTVGAALLRVDGWRSIYAAPLEGGIVLLLATCRFAESARIDLGARFKLSDVARDYLSVLVHPLALGNILCNAGAAGAVFAYITGSSLFFINVVGLSPGQYGLIFGASSISVMGGAALNQRLGRRGMSPGRLLAIGLAVTVGFAAFFLVMTLARWTPMPVVMSAMMGVAVGFGLISPNAIHAAMQPLPQIAGAVSAAAAFLQLGAAACSSGLVAALFDGKSALSMAALMLLFSLLSAAAYLGVVRPAERLNRA